MNHQARWIPQSAVAVVLLAIMSSESWLGAVDCWSSQRTVSMKMNTKTPTALSSVSSSSDKWYLSSRRSVLSTVAWTLLVGEAALMGDPKQADAADDDGASFLYTRKQIVLNKKELNYQILIPSSMKEGSKPVKTHLDEVNFMSETVKRYQYGITVDPVRISSLKEFGTPEEVAARVVTAEVNRDGIFEVTLLEDPYRAKSSDDDGVDAYILKYLSVGKRGRKVYTNKIAVTPNGLLYVLTAQCKEDDFPHQEKEIKSTVDSFRTY